MANVRICMIQPALYTANRLLAYLALGLSLFWDLIWLSFGQNNGYAAASPFIDQGYSFQEHMHWLYRLFSVFVLLPIGLFSIVNCRAAGLLLFVTFKLVSMVALGRDIVQFFAVNADDGGPKWCIPQLSLMIPAGPPAADSKKSNQNLQTFS